MVYISFLVTHCTHCVIHIYLFHIDLTLLTSLSSIFRDVMSILHSSKINLKTSECSFDNKDGDRKWSSSEVRNFSRARKCPNPLMFLHGALASANLVESACQYNKVIGLVTPLKQSSRNLHILHLQCSRQFGTSNYLNFHKYYGTLNYLLQVLCNLIFMIC